MKKVRMVYFIQNGENGPIKIGFSNRPRERLRIMQIGNPKKMILRASVPGGRELEYLLHQVFREDRVKGEWFKPSVALLELIDECQDGILPRRFEETDLSDNLYSENFYPEEEIHESPECDEASQIVYSDRWVELADENERKDIPDVNSRMPPAPMAE